MAQYVSDAAYVAQVLLDARPHLHTTVLGRAHQQDLVLVVTRHVDAAHVTDVLGHCNRQRGRDFVLGILDLLHSRKQILRKEGDHTRHTWSRSAHMKSAW